LSCLQENTEEEIADHAGKGEKIKNLYHVVWIVEKVLQRRRKNAQGEPKNDVNSFLIVRCM